MCAAIRYYGGFRAVFMASLQPKLRTMSWPACTVHVGLVGVRYSGFPDRGLLIRGTRRSRRIEPRRVSAL